MSVKEKARPASLQDYQDWLESIGIYTSGNWCMNDHKKALPLFTQIKPHILMTDNSVVSVWTDNPEINASIHHDFAGTIVDLLNVQIVRFKGFND